MCTPCLDRAERCPRSHNRSPVAMRRRHVARPPAPTVPRRQLHRPNGHQADVHCRASARATPIRAWHRWHRCARSSVARSGEGPSSARRRCLPRLRLRRPRPGLLRRLARQTHHPQRPRPLHHGRRQRHRHLQRRHPRGRRGWLCSSVASGWLERLGALGGLLLLVLLLLLLFRRLINRAQGAIRPASWGRWRCRQACRSRR